MAYGVIYGILEKQSQVVWILPICLQMLAPVVTCVMAPRLPESPRWLVEKGRTEEARSALLFLRGGKDGYDVDADLRGLEENFQAAQSKRQLGWLECFKGRNLARTNVCVGVQRSVGSRRQTLAFEIEENARRSQSPARPGSCLYRQLHGHLFHSAWDSKPLHDLAHQ